MFCCCASSFKCMLYMHILLQLFNKAIFNFLFCKLIPAFVECVKEN